MFRSFLLLAVCFALRMYSSIYVVPSPDYIVVSNKRCFTVIRINTFTRRNELNALLRNPTWKVNARKNAAYS